MGISAHVYSSQISVRDQFLGGHIKRVKAAMRSKMKVVAILPSLIVMDIVSPNLDRDFFYILIEIIKILVSVGLIF